MFYKSPTPFLSSLTGSKPAYTPLYVISLGAERKLNFCLRSPLRMPNSSMCFSKKQNLLSGVNIPFRQLVIHRLLAQNAVAALLKPL